MSISWQFYEGRYNEVIESLSREKNPHYHNCKFKKLAQEADIALCEFRNCHSQEFHEKAVTANHEYAKALEEFPSNKIKKQRHRHWIRSVLLTAINGVWLQLFHYHDEDDDDDMSLQLEKQLDIALKQMMRAFSTCIDLEKTLVGQMTISTTTTTSSWDCKNPFVLLEKWDIIKLKWFHNDTNKKKRNEKDKYVKDQVEHTLRILLIHYHSEKDYYSSLQQQQELKKEVTFNNNDSTTETIDESIEREHTTTLPQHCVSKALVFYKSHNDDDDDDMTQTCLEFFLRLAVKVEGNGSWSYVLFQSIQAMQFIHSKRNKNLQQENNNVTNLLRNLEPHSSTSILICQIVASLYIKLGQVTNALKLWQTALKLAIEENIDHRLLISNIAHAFFIIGNIPASLEMYLYVLTSTSTLKNHQNERMANKLPLKVAQKMNFHLSFQDNTNGHDNKVVSIYKKDYDTIILSGNTQIDLLRKLYEAAMLCGDWVTCITSSEQLLQKHSNNENPIKLAKIFALMQGCRISLAWKELQIDNVSVPIDNLGGIECQILWYLYKADVSILLKRVVQLNDNDDNVDGNKDSTEMKQEIEKIHSLTTFSWSLCEKLMKKRKSDDSIKSQIHQELMIAVWNNFGLTWFLKGNMFKAMSSFRKAIQYVQEQQDTSMQKSNSLHVFFNMSLLLWKHGHKQEATKIWLTARGFITTIEAEKPLSDTESKRATIERLKRDLQKAVKKNELINEEIKIGKYELSLEPITRWHPSVQRDENSNHQNADCIGGIQPDQCTAVDIMLLRHMVWYLAREDGSQFLQNSRY